MAARSTFALLTTAALCVSLAACASDEDGPVGPLQGGDAEWPQAPIPQPGDQGQGETGDDGSGDDAGTSTDGTTDDGGWGTEETTTDDGGPDIPCESAPDHLMCDVEPGVCEAVPWADWGDTETDTGTESDSGTDSDSGTGTGTDGETGTDTDTDTGDTGVPPMTPVPCCEDVDCACFDGACWVDACLADDWCDCNCPVGADPDCPPDSCGLPAHEAGHEEAACPDTTEPVVLYMSNDDSNSQASPAVVRRIVDEGGLVPANRVRIHEFLNYYTLAYEPPTDAPARVGIQMRRTNSETGEFTLLLSAQGQELRPEDRPPLNLVFSLDRSGSMSGDAIELLKDTVRATAAHLRSGDVVSLVEWDTMQGVMLDGHTVTGPDDPTLIGIVDAIEADGGTNLHDGLVTAYDLANAHYMDDGLNRVLIVSDGGANAGITDTDLIAAEASEEDGKGIYLIGVGVGEAAGYNDHLMDELTDAGKGAYLFIDSTDEAERMFGDPIRFLTNTTVAARDVQMELTMPWYFGIKSFHGEEYSANPEEVEPQHLANNDAMSFHQIIQSCDPNAPLAQDRIKAKVTYLHPLTYVEMTDEYEASLGALVNANADTLYKGDVVVNFAKAFIAIAAINAEGEYEQAAETAEAMVGWLKQAAITLDDDEIHEMAAVMETYRQTLETLN